MKETGPTGPTGIRVIEPVSAGKLIGSSTQEIVLYLDKLPADRLVRLTQAEARRLANTLLELAR